jgi:hypothetical protein
MGTNEPMSGESHPDERTSLIDTFMAEYDVQDVTCAVVDVEPARIFTTLRGYDLTSDSIPAALFRARTALDAVSDALLGRARRVSKPHLTIEDIVASGSGFVLLGERPRREFAIGSVGRFRQPKITFVRVAPGDFASFAQRGFAKLVWSVQVHPYGRSQAVVTVDVRVKTFDAASLARFSRYWHVIGPFSRLMRRRAIARAVTEAQSFFPARIPS